MRSVGAASVVLILLAAPFGVGAQTEVVHEQVVLTDPEKDVELFSGDGVLSLGDGTINTVERGGPMDLVALSIHESEDRFVFSIQVRDMDGYGHAPVLEDGIIRIHFILGDIKLSYIPGDEDGTGDPDDLVTVPRDRLRLTLDQGFNGQRASLARYDLAREDYVDYYQLCSGFACDTAVEIDLEADAWILPIPRVQLQDAGGTSPNPGMRFHSFTVEALSDGELNDAMPDDGKPVGEFLPTIGLEQTGHIRLTSVSPTRPSNGEATSYYYRVALSNLGEKEDFVGLEAIGVPDDWELTLPGKRIRMDGDKVLWMPIIVTTPFRHTHGQFEGFLLEARSENNPDSIGRIELGIQYSAVPHPTGHHPRVWIHAGGPPPEGDSEGGGTTREVYMNALAPEDDPLSRNANILPASGGSSHHLLSESSVARWRIDLEPAIGIGLDFNLSREGALSIPFLSPHELNDATLQGKLYYYPAGSDPSVGPWLLAEINPDDPQDVPANQEREITATLIPEEVSDYIRYRALGAWIFMDLELRWLATDEAFVMGSVPHMVPGGTVDLPLDEYHDQVDYLYNLYLPINQIEVSVVDGEKKPVNSGETVAFDVRVLNTGDAMDIFNFELIGGLDHEWATVYGDITAAIAPGEFHDFHVAVTAPKEGTWQGRVAGPLLEISSETNQYLRVQTRVFAEVDDSEDHEDMSYVLKQGIWSDGESDGVSTPAPSGLPLLLLLLAAFVVRTRRL